MSEDPHGDRRESQAQEPGQGRGAGSGRAAPGRAGGWQGLFRSRQGVAVVVLVVLAVYLVSRFAIGPDTIGCTQGLTGRTQWSQDQVGVRLSDLWTRGAEGFDVADAQLAHLTVAWDGTGSMVQLEIQGRTSVGLQITVSSAGRSGAETMTVYSDSAALGTSTTTSGQVSDTGETISSARPPLIDVLGSIDAVGFEGLRTAALVELGEEEGLIVELGDETWLQPGMTVETYAGGSTMFGAAGGELVPLEGAVVLPSLAPAQVFVVSKAQVLGRGAGVMPPPLAYVVVH